MSLSTYICMYVYICICSYSYCTICVLLSLSGFQLENGEMSVCVNSIKILRFTNVDLLTVFCHFNTLICGSTQPGKRAHPKRITTVYILALLFSPPLWHTYFSIFTFLPLSLLATEPRTLCMLRKSFSIELQPWPLLFLEGANHSTNIYGAVTIWQTQNLVLG